jgi:hypothetical protein
MKQIPRSLCRQKRKKESRNKSLYKLQQITDDLVGTCGMTGDVEEMKLKWKKIKRA